jgi:hypothetical protein
MNQDVHHARIVATQLCTNDRTSLHSYYSRSHQLEFRLPWIIPAGCSTPDTSPRLRFEQETAFSYFPYPNRQRGEGDESTLYRAEKVPIGRITCFPTKQRIMMNILQRVPPMHRIMASDGACCCGHLCAHRPGLTTAAHAAAVVQILAPVYVSL